MTMTSRYACRLFHSALLGIAILGTGAVGLRGQSTAGKQSPVPSAEAQKKVLALIRDVFKKEYEEAKTASQKGALAAELFKRGVQSDDATERFVLLRVSRDMAAMIGDADAACRAVDEMARHYRIDPLAMKRETLAKAAERATRAEHHKAVAEQGVALVEDAILIEDFPKAKELAATALAAARKANDPELIARIAARTEEIDQAAKGRTGVDEALAALEKNPGDPKANLVVGRYYCLVKGDWRKGLPMLALSGDGTFDALARKELVGARTSTLQVALADGWWELVGNSEGLAQRHLRARAAHWYEEALPDLSGLTRLRVQKRLSEIESAETPGGGESPRRKPGEEDPKVKPVKKKPSFQGKWRDRFGSTIEFKVENRKAVGSYKNVDKSYYRSTYTRYEGRILGKVSRDGRTLTGQWQRTLSSYERPGIGGNLVFKLSKDGSAFVGTYDTGPGSRANAWTGARAE